MGSQPSKTVNEAEDEGRPEPSTREEIDEEEVEDDEVDEWDKRIISTGCEEENDRMRDCHFEKKDWRLCIPEMEQFKKCWKAHGNVERTGQRDL